MENLDVSSIIAIVLGAITTFAGGFWLKAKKKLGKVVRLGVESIEVIAKFEEAIADNNISKEEIESLKKEANDVKVAFNDLISKE